jgi:RNA polymerase sigma-70 factor (family 1)
LNYKGADPDYILIDSIIFQSKTGLHKKHYTEEDAKLALLHGKEEGLNYYFQHYYTPLSYLAFRLLGNSQAAEEIAAEAFVKLWGHRHRLTEEGSIKAWLNKTVRHACIDQLRRVKRMAVTDTGLACGLPAEEKNVLHCMIEAELLQQVLEAAKALPAGCRLMFEKYYVEGKTPNEIAAELNVSVSTVNSQKARALELLRKKLPHLCWLAMASLL